MIVGLGLAFAISMPQTPLDGAAAFLRRPGESIASARVLLTTPKYAVVGFKSLWIEGDKRSGYLLVKRFSFGWQAIDMNVLGRLTICSVQSHGVPSGDLAALRRVLSPDRSECSERSDQRDIGNQADIDIVRTLMRWHNEVISFVRVIDGYAMGEWWGNGGGESFFKKTPLGWKGIFGGGGAADVQDLTSHGIPLATAKKLLKGL